MYNARMLASIHTDSVGDARNLSWLHARNRSAIAQLTKVVGSPTRHVSVCEHGTRCIVVIHGHDLGEPVEREGNRARRDGERCRLDLQRAANARDEALRIEATDALVVSKDRSRNGEADARRLDRMSGL